MKRVRVLIYTHNSPEWHKYQRSNAGVQGIKQVMGGTIESIEIDPTRITILQLIRLFWREANHGANSK